MKNLKTEKPSIDFSEITLSQLETSRDKLREEINKIGNENVLILRILNSVLTEANICILIKKLSA